MQTSKKFQRGGIAVELISALMVLGMVIAFASRQTNETTKTSRATTLANQLNMVSKGAQNYLDANSSQISEQLDDSTGRNYLIIDQTGVKDNLMQPVTLDGSANNGLAPYMPVRFQKTRYGQNVRMHAYKGPDGTLHALVSTYGGDVRSPGIATEYMSVARQASGMNGFGMFREANNKGQAVNAIVGPSDTWRFVFNDSDYGMIPQSDFSEGQLARPLYAYSAAIKDDLLYRTEIDGHPEMNAMQTDLHMNGNTITDVGTLTISQNPAIQGSTDHAATPPGGNGLVIEPYTTTGNIADSAQFVCDGAGGPAKPNGFIFTVANDTVAGQDEDDLNGIWTCFNGKARLISDSRNSTSVKAVFMAKHNDLVVKPQCPQNTKPSIVVSEAAFGEKQTKPGNIVAVQSYAKDEGDKWRVQIRLKTTSQKNDNEWINPVDNPDGSGYNFAVVQTSCQRDISSM